MRIRAEQAAGRLAAIDSDLIEDLLVGLFWYRALVSDVAITRTLADQVVVSVLSIKPPGPATS